MPLSSEDDLSDEEIFFGKLTIKEVKKRILRSSHGQSKTSPDRNTSIKVIESHSEPNLRRLVVNTSVNSSVPGSPAVGDKSGESFIQMENMVSKVCSSPIITENLELNDTLEVFEYILNNGPKQNISNSETEKDVEKSNLPSVLSHYPSQLSPNKMLTPQQTSTKQNSSKSETEKEVETSNLLSAMSPYPSKLSPNIFLTPQQTSPMTKDDNAIRKSPKYFTPVGRKIQQGDVCDAPSSANVKSKTAFKTPSNCLSQKKPSASSVKKTPAKTNSYQYIQSPVAFYINSSPSMPRVKNILPKTPLPTTSSIPKDVKSPRQNKIQNKENINLPSIAYKSAKNTKVIQIPGESEKKLPQSQWARNVKSGLPRPTVMKHGKKEMNVLTKPSVIVQDDTLGNISLFQADESVCTTKSDFKTK